MTDFSDLFEKLRHEAQEEEALSKGLLEHFTVRRPDLGEQLARSVADWLLREPPDEAIIERLTAGAKSWVSREELAEACVNHDRLEVVQVGGAILIGLKSDDLVMPEVEVGHVHRFLQEHSESWVAAPFVGCFVWYEGDWDGDIVVTIPQLLDQHGDPFAEECDFNLGFFIKQALKLETHWYNPATGESAVE